MGTSHSAGNGCFWGRQKDFVDVEKKDLGRSEEAVSAVVGYAGGRQSGPDGRICYYYGPGKPEHCTTVPTAY